MIAGYDYLILRNGARSFWTRTRIAGATLVLAGGILIGVGAAYYGYASNARANLDEYNVAAVELVPIVAQEERVKPLALSGPSIIGEVSLYSGDAGFIPVQTGPELPDGFVLIDLTEENSLAPVAAATSISVLGVEIDASIVELSIQDLGGRRAYETPDNSVGHIPETHDAGENGDAWFFGHMESPLIGEGSVFRNLDQIPDKLANGEEVQIITSNGTEEFLYRVTATRIVHEDDITLDGDGGPNIHLVACFPRLVYDHRLIVDAELIAKKTSS
jgi:LPXTG-site transpeptidase (sortase) family protein